MLTRKKIELYQSFSGDIDGLSRVKGAAICADEIDLTNSDWQLITELEQALLNIKAGQTSEQFRLSTEEKLLENTADDDTRKALNDLVKKC